MTITDFSLLTTTEKLDILYKEGVYLFKRRTGNTVAVLYQYHKLYIEIYYTKYRQHVMKIRCSEDTDILNPYFDNNPMEINF